MSDNILNTINSPKDVKELTQMELRQLANEIRERILQVVSNNGGHLSSNLGMVDATLALHKVFNSPIDQIIWDVGHQCYTHKIITGRNKMFDSIRTENGLSGFPKPSESIHDIFIAGHASTSISVASGLAKAKSIQNQEGSVVAIIGDGALTGGLAYEGLNNAGRSGDKIVVILNDNEMSISKNVGALSKYLSSIRSTKKYFNFKDRTEKTLKKVPLIGKTLRAIAYESKATVKRILYRETIFEQLGFVYFGPIDGHDITLLCEVLTRAKELECPVLVHIETTKGKGYAYAEENPGGYHGTSKFDSKVGTDLSKPSESFSSVFGTQLTALAQKDHRICAVTAAMKYGTGLDIFAAKFKQENRFFDVGIAEAHGVAFCAGLATNGMVPVFALYSTFLQRAVDQLIHDVAIENKHIVLAIDRAGVVGEDGETHQGVFDVSIASAIPNVVIYSPSTYDELAYALNQAIYENKGIGMVRYPKGKEYPLTGEMIPVVGDYYYLKNKNNHSKLLVITYGRVYGEVCESYCNLKDTQYGFSILKLNRITQLPQELFSMIKMYEKIIVVEEGMLCGGIGQQLFYLLQSQGIHMKQYTILAIDAQFIPQATVHKSLESIGLTNEKITAFIKENS
ncbi:MAG: 1-deoxy-D-xylulose-5-phosphate synthase [Oscillospiraceae bacterium]